MVVGGWVPGGAAALPCVSVELCRKTWILLEFFTTHVSFLGGGEVKQGPNHPTYT